MRRHYFIILFLLFSLSGSVPANQESDLLQQVVARLALRTSVEGRFQQEKFLEFLARPVLSSGEFSIGQGGVMTWHVIEPVESLMRIEGTKVTLDGKSVRDYGMSRMMSMLMAGFMDGEMGEIDRHFEVSGEVGETGWQLTLEPVTGRFKSALKHVGLTGNQHLQSIEISDSGGGRTLIEFSDVHSATQDERSGKSG